MSIIKILDTWTYLKCFKQSSDVPPDVPPETQEYQLTVRFEGSPNISFKLFQNDVHMYSEEDCSGPYYYNIPEYDYVSL